MRDLREKHRTLFRLESCDALDRVQVALEFLWKEDKKSMHDKVAGDFDYEELIAGLLCAEEALQAAERETEPRSPLNSAAPRGFDANRRRIQMLEPARARRTKNQ